MDQNFTVIEYASDLTFFKNDIVFMTVGSNRVYYYSLANDNINNSPDASPDFWSASFFWLPDYSSSIDITPRKIEIKYGDGYAQRSRDGINTSPLIFSLSFNGRTDKEAAAIAHFIEQRGGVDSFVYNHATIFNKTGLKYIAKDCKISHQSYNLNNLSVTLERSFN